MSNKKNNEVLEIVQSLLDRGVDFDISISVKNGMVVDSNIAVSQSKKTDNDIAVQPKNLEDRIEYIMERVGVPENLLGYAYIKEAMLIMSNKKPKVGVVKEVYVPVAKKMGSTSSRVERAIRHSIAVTFRKDKCTAEREAVFGHTIEYGKELPTNSQFLSALSKVIQKYEL